MQLYQLAMELDERSADVAERAVALGLGRIDPTSNLTAEQAASLRAAYGRPAGGPVPDGPVTVIGPAATAQAEGPPPAPGGRSGRGRKVGIAVGCALALAGAVAFFAVQASPGEERQAAMADDLAAWEAAPPATVAPEVKVAAAFPPDQPRDPDQLCAALQTVIDEEATIPDIEPTQTDFSELRSWTTDRGAWRDAVAKASAAGPVNAVPDAATYVDVWDFYFQALYEASDSELRSMADGIELNDLETFSDDILEAREDWQDHVLRFCPGLEPAA